MEEDIVFEKDLIGVFELETKGDLLFDIEEDIVFEKDSIGVFDIEPVDVLVIRAELVIVGDGVLDNKYKETFTTTPENVTLPSEVICNLIELEVI
jgi:hypothetical protein